MVDCPTCGWGMQKRTEYETGGYVFGNYFCNSCPTTVQVKSPTTWMTAEGRWE
jgi:transposase-like protein